MGMFDTIMAPCPQCGHKNGVQSKGGECKLAVYELDEVPIDVLSDANRHPMKCKKCGTPYKIAVKCIVSVVRTEKTEPSGETHTENIEEAKRVQNVLRKIR